MTSESFGFINSKRKILFTALILLSCIISDNECAITKRQTDTIKQVCGIPQKNTGLIVNGSELKRGRFPWMAALMLISRHPPIFFCGGSLISDKHVVTGEHSKISFVRSC